MYYFFHTPYEQRITINNILKTLIFFDKSGA